MSPDSQRVFLQLLQVGLVGVVVCVELEGWDVPLSNVLAHSVFPALTLEVALAGFPFCLCCSSTSCRRREFGFLVLVSPCV